MTLGLLQLDIAFHFLRLGASGIDILSRPPLAPILTITNIPVITTILLISHTRTFISESSLCFFLFDKLISFTLPLHSYYLYLIYALSFYD